MNENHPIKGIKIQSKNKLSDHISSLRTLDERIKNFLKKEEKYKLRSQEIGLAVGYLLINSKSENAPQHIELENLVLQHCLSLAEDLNFDPETKDDNGTFMLFAILMKSLFQLSKQNADANEKIKELDFKLNSLIKKTYENKSTDDTIKTSQ